MERVGVDTVMITKRSAKIIAISLLGSTLFAQQTTLDWKLHDVGKVRQFISNIGSLWPTGHLSSDYPGLIYCEFPPNSGEEHVGEGGIWVGAVVGSDSLVSVTTSWNSSQEFFPTSAPWDTIWVAARGDTLDIPYWPKYVGVSDQDFVCRYSDYNPASIRVGTHTPLFLDVIQISHAWSSAPLDEMIVYDFYVIPTKINLNEVFIAWWLDGNVGFCTECRFNFGFALDDLSRYYADQHLGVSVDQPGYVDGLAFSPIGIKIYPPENVSEDSLRWTFNWYPGGGLGAPPGDDALRYGQMAEGTIMQDQVGGVGSQFIVSLGPFDLTVGDTLHFRVGQILGEGLEGMFVNVERLDWLIENDFRVPSPPPAPPLRAITQNHVVALEWDPRPGEVNPETYVDSYRADNAAQPFEGYRVYKSTLSATGPWTLLAEFDIAGNEYGQNIGLEYEYSDVGLLNNLEYFYTVTAFSKPDTASDFPSQESSLNATAKVAVPGTVPPPTVGEVAVVPNPYRGDITYHSFNPPWEKPDPTRKRWLEQDRRIQFINLPSQCEIKIYTLAGDLVETIRHDDPDRGYEDWNLTSHVAQAISSGIYLFTVEDTNNGQVQVGKFVVIK